MVSRNFRTSDYAALLPLVGLVIAFAGLFAASILSLGHLLKLPVPCGGSRGCMAVAIHPSSKLFGVPIAYFGAIAYVVVIAVICRTPSANSARVANAVLTCIGTAVSGILLYYSYAVIGTTCVWCVASGLAMLVLFALSLLLVSQGSSLRAVHPIVVWGLALLTSAGTGIQAGLMERDASRPPIPAEHLRALTAKDLVDPAKTLGSADAPVTIIIFADLWCPGCRAIHAPLIEYQKKNSAGVRLAYRHLPLYRLRGHQFSGTLAALSEIAAENAQFWSFVELVNQQPRALSGKGYLQLLRRLHIDPEDVESRLSDSEDAAYARVLGDMQVAEDLGVTATPTFIVLADDLPPVSATQRTLPRILNSPAVLGRMAQASQASQRAE